MQRMVAAMDACLKQANGRRRVLDAVCKGGIDERMGDTAAECCC